MGLLGGVGRTLFSDTARANFTIGRKLLGESFPGRVAKYEAHMAGRIARRTARDAAIAGAGIGVAGIAFDKMVRNNDKPKDTPLMDAIMAISMGDPQADRKILGTDVTAMGMFNPISAMRPPPWSYINSTTFGDTKYINPGTGGYTQDEVATAAQGIIDTGESTGTQSLYSTDNPYYAARSIPGIRYRPSSKRPTNMVDGSMVFGMYNLRR